MTDKKAPSTAQAEAHRRYEKKRSRMARLPGGYLSDEEADLLDEMAALYDSKKDAIIVALRLLKDKHNKS